MSILYRAAVFVGDVANMLWPLQVPPQDDAADVLAEAEAETEVWSPAATIRDVVDRLDDIRNQLHQLSARPGLLPRDDCADPPPAADPQTGGGGHPTSPDHDHLPRVVG